MYTRIHPLLDYKALCDCIDVCPVLFKQFHKQRERENGEKSLIINQGRGVYNNALSLYLICLHDIYPRHRAKSM